MRGSASWGKGHERMGRDASGEKEEQRQSPSSC